MFGPVPDLCVSDFSANAQEFAYCDRKGRIHVASLRTHLNRVVASRGQNPDFSASGTYLAVTTFRPGFEDPVPTKLRVYDLRTGRVQRMAFPQGGFAWASGREAMAWTDGLWKGRGAHLIHIADANDLAHSRVIRIPGDGYVSLVSWGWQDRTILYWTLGRSLVKFRLWAVSISTGRRMLLASDPYCGKGCSPGYGYFPTATAVGKHVVVSDYTGIWPSPGWPRQPFFTFVKKGLTRPVYTSVRWLSAADFRVSPDGRQVLMSWEVANKGNGMAFGVDLWSVGHSHAESLGHGIDAWWCSCGARGHAT